MSFGKALSSILSSSRVADNIGKEAASKAGAVAQGSSPVAGALLAASGDHAKSTFVNAKGDGNYSFTVLVMGLLGVAGMYAVYNYCKNPVSKGKEKASVSTSDISGNNKVVGVNHDQSLHKAAQIVAPVFNASTVVSSISNGSAPALALGPHCIIVKAN